MQIMNLVNLFKNFIWSFSSVNSLPDACIFVDKTGLIRYSNRRAKDLLGFDAGDEFKKVDDVIVNAMSAIDRSAQFLIPVLVSTLPEQNGLYVELNAVKNFGGYTVTIRDLTNLTNTKAEAENILRFNGEKNAMIAMLENDIKSPITSISGFSQGLLDGLGGVLTEKQAKYVKIINNNSEDLFRFMDKFISFSKVESLMYESEYKVFDITELIKNVSKDFQQSLFDRKLYFDLDYSTLSKYNVYSDIKAIKEAYRNILEISSESVENGGIRVLLSHPSEHVCSRYFIDPQKSHSYVQLLIKDTGSGFAKEDLKYLCDPYAQLEKGKKNILRALILGTASILIKRANGFIDINTEVLEGTEYLIIFPIEKE